MNILCLILLIQCGIFVDSSNINEPPKILSHRALRGGNGADITNTNEELISNRALLELGSLNTARYLGEKELLVIRIEAKDSSTTASESEIRKDIFESEVNLPKQYAACSRGKLTFKAAQGRNISNGVATVTLDKVVGRMTYSSNTENIVKDIESMSPSMFGRELKEFDQVMVCMPPGTTVVNPHGETTDKYTAFVPGDKPLAFFLSIYSDEWCTSLSAGMHEVGHTLGLNHAGESINGQYAQYEDETGMMGYSAKSKDGPLKCFNPAKSWQLGWYADQSKRINPLTDAPLRTVLTGITRDINDNDKSKNILIQIPNGNKNIYIGYNQAIGYNAETEADKADKVLIMEQDYGGANVRLAFSTVLAKLDSNDAYTIKNYQGTGGTLVIQANDKIANGNEVPVDIYFQNDKNPSKRVCMDDQVRFEVNFVTDAYSKGRVGWNLVSDITQNTVAVHAQSDTESLSPYNKLVCIDPEENYTFTFKADHGIGICCNGGFGFYSVFLEGEEIFRGGEFGAFNYPGDKSPKVFSVSHKFKTEKGTSQHQMIPMSITKPPTQAPTWVSPPSPTTSNSCVDDPDYKWKGRSEWDCAWVAERRGKRCASEIDGNRVRDYCRKTCYTCGGDGTKPTMAPVAAPTPTTTAFEVEPPTAPTTITAQIPSPTASPVNHPTSDESMCTDDTKFRWKSVQEWDCAWVAMEKDKRCSRAQNGVRVKDSCRKTCDSCIVGANPTTPLVTAPITSPTVAPAKPTTTNENMCIDDPKFRWKSAEQWNCAWVASDKDKRCTRELNGVRVKDHCRKVCNTCGSDDTPTQPPTMVPIAASEPVANDKSLCIDDPTFKFKGKSKFNCAWVKRNREKRCPKKKNGKKVKDHCRKTCNSCDSGSGLTSSQVQAKPDDPSAQSSAPVETTPIETVMNNLCMDDSSFKWRDNPNWNCAWVAMEKDKRCWRENNSVKIKDKCRATCGQCNEMSI